MTVKLANNVSGFLNTAITASDTGIVLQSGNGASFPALGAGEYFYATLVSTGNTLEVVKVTARSGDSMTVVRAQDNSSAASFAAGSRLEMRVNAAAVRDAIGDVVASQVGFTPVGGIAATDVQAALAEVDSEKIAFTRLDDSDGSSLVGFLQSGSGAVTRTAQSKMRDVVSVKDFGAVGDGVADDTAAMAAAHATGNIVYYPAGAYLFTKLTAPITRGGIVGDGPTSTVLNSSDTSSDALLVFNALWQNNLPQKDNNALVFRDFSVQCPAAKTLGACIEVTAPIISTVQQENQISVFDNVTCRNFATGIYFKSASFWKVLNCNFIEYRVAGIQVANIYNSDSGDGMITNCLFETNPVSAGNAGILQNSSGGLKITGCKFLGASFGYKMAWTGAASSNLQIVNNSFELMDTFAISLARTSGTATFSLINITGNNFALSGFHIGTDSNTWLSKIAVTGNIFELWGGYASVLNSIGLNNVNNLIICGNTFIGAGVTSVAISLVNPTNGQVGLNNYFGITTPVDQSGAVNVPVALTEQSGSATTSSTGWTTYGSALFQSTITNVTFDAPYSIAPDPNNVRLTAGDGSGTVAGIVGSVTITGFSFRALNVFNDRASTIYWSVKGYV
jgi:hypothetical protein